MTSIKNYSKEYENAKKIANNIIKINNFKWEYPSNSRSAKLANKTKWTIETDENEPLKYKCECPSYNASLNNINGTILAKWGNPPKQCKHILAVMIKEEINPLIYNYRIFDDTFDGTFN